MSDTSSTIGAINGPADVGPPAHRETTGSFDVGEPACADAGGAVDCATGQPLPRTGGEHAVVLGGAGVLLAVGVVLARVARRA